MRYSPEYGLTSDPLRERGSAVVEFALVLPLVIILVLGVVEVAVAARTQLEVVGAARVGAREAAATPDPARASAAVRAELGAAGGRARIEVSRPHVVGARATVVVRLPHTVAAPVFGGFTVELKARATMRVER
jgi:Flp pilus assembly protein TadG